MRSLLYGVLTALWLLAPGGAGAGEAPPPTLAIIIDDLGNESRMAGRLARLDYPLTLAFLPYRPHTPRLARLAHRHGKEIMLHAPMANSLGLPLGAGALEPGMPPEQLSRILRRSLRAIPHVSGVNNHTGSLLTRQRAPMDAVMAEIRRYPLYFVDSRTISTSVAESRALAHQIPTLRRDVFLDHVQEEAHIHRQFQRLLALARKQGSAVAIGHPHEVTVRYLEKMLPKLDEQGFALATVSALWRLRHENRPLFAEKREPLPALLAQAADQASEKRTPAERQQPTYWFHQIKAASQSPAQP